VTKTFFHSNFVLHTFAVLLLSAGMASAQSPIIWVAPSLQRVGPSDAAGSGTQAQLYAGKGEYESFQIIVKAPSGGLSNVNVSVSDLTSSSGQTILKSNLALFREQYVNVTSSSPNWGGSNQPLPPGWYPDPLIPFVDANTGLPAAGGSIQAVPFSLAAGANQPIWVDVFVPRSAAAGFYNGTYTVTSSQGSATGQISLQVWNFTLPLKPTLKSAFAYWSAGSLAADQELLRNKVMPLGVSTGNQLSLIANLGLSTTNTGPFSGADVSTCTMSAAPSVAQFQAVALAQQPGLYLFDYSADEVGSCSNLYTTLQQWAANMHQAGINNLVTMAPVAALLSDGTGTGRSAVDDWVMLPVMYDNSLSTVQQAYQKGDSLWSYNTLVQDSYSPKWEIDFAPINFRIEPGFISQSLNLTGLLYWRVDDWNSSPWTNPNNAGTFATSNYPGEAVLVYPGSTVGVTGVAPSMRLKWIRDGVEDYEYVNLLKQAGKGAWALQISQSVGANWTSWTRDINALASARLQLGQQLDALGGGSSSLPSAPGSPSPASGTINVSTAPALSWAASSGATSYDVYFGTTSSPSLKGTVTGASYSPGTLGNNTAYYWKVVAKNTSGSTSSAVWSFTTDAPTVPPPTAPASPSPASGATGVSATPTLSWAASSGATSYDVYFGTSSSPALVKNVTTTGYLPGTLTNSAVYYWKVVAKNTSGSTSSAVWSFTTVAPTVSVPTAPASPSPASGATGVSTTPTLSWAASSGATSYDVYFGTSSSPALAKNVTTSSYQPGTLVNSTAYYWKVVAKNTSGSTSSAVWSFTTVASAAASGPASVSVSPSSGTGLYNLFSFVYSDSSGYQYLKGVHALVNSSTSYTNACWMYYDASAKVLWLASNDTSTWSNLALGSDATLQNSQCEITGSGVSVTGSGNNLTLNIPVIFTTAFAGTKNIYMNATDTSGVTTSTVSRGTWTVPVSTALGTVAVSPSSGSGFGHAFSFVFSDPNGYASLTGVHAVVNSSLSATNACWIYYDTAGKMLWLSSNDTSTWSNVAVGTNATIQNSQCSINGSGISVTGSGNYLTLTVPITFSSSFAGTRYVYASATDMGGTASSYIQSGSWVVP